MKPLDIANLSECSDYLSDFAEANIYKQYADCRIFNYNSWTWTQFTTIFRHFGNHFKRLTLNRLNTFGVEKPSLNHLAIALRHCPNLDKLTVKNFKLLKNEMSVLRREQCSAKHLELELNSGIGYGWRELLQLWPNVCALTLHRFSDDLLPDYLVGGVHSLQQLTLTNGFMRSQKLLTSLQKHQNSFTKLSLIEMNESSKYRYIEINKKLPQLEHLQISIMFPPELAALTGMKLKYLQLIGCATNPFSSKFQWSLKNLPLLEELELVEILGFNCRVAGNLPTLRLLSIQRSKIGKDHGLVETLAKLPNLQRLHFRKSHFIPEDLVEVIETIRSLTEIQFDTYKKHEMIELLQSLSERAKDKIAPLVPRSDFELRVIIEDADVRKISNY